MGGKPPWIWLVTTQLVGYLLFLVLFALFIFLNRAAVFLALSLSLVLSVLGATAVPLGLNSFFVRFPDLGHLPVKPEERHLLGHAVPEKASRASIHLRFKNLPLLFASSAVCVFGLYLLLSSQAPILENSAQLSEERSSPLMLLMLLSLGPLWLAWNWFYERAVLKNAAMTIAAIVDHTRSSGRKWVAYEFRNLDGGYLGGTKPEREDVTGDTLIVVFVNVVNADMSLPQCSFRYHRFSLIEFN